MYRIERHKFLFLFFKYPLWMDVIFLVELFNLVEKEEFFNLNINYS